MDYRQMRQKRYLIAAWAFMECVLFGGLLYGWGSLMFVFKQEGIYAELCNKDQAVSAITNSSSRNNSVSYEVTSGVTSNVIVLPVTNVALINSSEDETSSASNLNGCPEQDSKFMLCFTIASALFCASSAVLGQINFMFGTRVTRIISMIIFVSGSLMLAFVSKEIPWLIFPGLSFLAAGGLPLLVTNTQISNLFGKGSSSIVGLLCGGFDISSAVQLLVKIAYESGIARQHSYYFLTALHSLVLVSTFILLPKDFIPKEEATRTNSEVADEKDITIELLKRSKEGGDVVDEKTGVLKDNNYKKKELPTLMSCVRQPLYIIHVFWLCILQLRFYYLIGTLNPYLNRVLNKDDKMVSHFTNICFYIMMGGLLSSFLTGVVYDWQKRCFANSRSSLRQNLMPAVLPLAIASFLAVLLSILVLIPVQSLLYLIFIIMTLFRSFLYSMGAAFLSAMFPSEYFGLLYGIMIIFGGVFGFLQFAFFTWAETYVGAPLHTDIFLLCLVLFSFIHPLYQWYRCSRAEKEFTI